MKTECPQCNTIFSITQQQLDIADGMVRCGVCSHVFNALVQDDLFVADDETPADPETASVITETPLTEAESDIPLEGTETSPTTDSDDTQTPAEIHLEEVIDEAIDEVIEDSVDEPATVEPLDTLFEGSDGQLVPDELRYQENRTSLAAALMIGIGILLLIAGLTLQFAWLERATLAKSDQLRPWLERACMQLDCTRIEVRMPDRIEMQSRNVYTHPTVDEALMISMSLVNRAGFAQPYPDIRIHFSDVIGNLIASRQFKPQEYLGISTQDLRLLEPDAPVSFGIGIVDPGARALTYEFEFL